jgi:CheY-like chemotaxis protein
MNCRRRGRSSLIEAEVQGFFGIYADCIKSGLVFAQRTAQIGYNLSQSNQDPHVALVDTNLPERSGVELVSYVRSQPRLKVMELVVSDRRSADAG